MQPYVRNTGNLYVDTTFTDRRADLIEENIALAVRLGDIEKLCKSCRAESATQRSVMCDSPAYIHSHGLLRRAEELLSHDSFGFSRDGRVLPWKLLDVNCSILQRQPTIRQIVSYGEELQEAAVKGMRIAYLSMWLPETKSLRVN